MIDSTEKPGRGISQHLSPGNVRCPSCGCPLKVDAKWCPGCGFKGGDTLDMFSDSPPPLLPILDAADIFTSDDVLQIEAARDSIRRDFPQFQWRICTIARPPDLNLSLFGFWLLNACPLHEDETMDERTWTILLLLHAGTGQAAVIPGYAAESFLSDDGWKKVLGSMAQSWSMGKSAEVVVRFFKGSSALLKLAWKRHGSRRTGN